jgi:16S rRNA (uracil1498-N3)-methyltransferase
LGVALIAFCKRPVTRVNIILFTSSEIGSPLPRRDPRSRHIVEILRRQPGDTFDAGLINGPRGKGTVQAIERDALQLTFTWGEMPPALPAIQLIIGMPRPQTARDILREGAALGVSAMEFVRTERGEPGYARSSLWSSREWESLLLAGAAQAFCTRLPRMGHGKLLGEALALLSAGDIRVALDNYESPEPLGRLPLPPDTPVALAIGSERGWTESERDLLRQHGFRFAHLGERVLRTETACITAVAVIKTKLDLF